MVRELLEKTFVRFPHLSGREVEMQLLEKGGSDRSFYRVSVPGGESLILAKYGQAREENRHYVSIARFLHDAGVRVPEILFHDEADGLIWMEDLGDEDLWSFRLQPWTTRKPLYQSALDQVLILHTRAHELVADDAPKFQPGFDAALYTWEQNYFLENCLGRHFGISADRIADLGNQSRLDEIAQLLGELPRCFVHRDFQSQNIVVKDQASCLIDFQGMRLGLAQYDLASLLYDPYVSLTAAERQELFRYYMDSREAQGLRLPSNFEEVFHLCAVQRLMQALGAYGFLGHVRERAHFLEHIPAALTNLREVLVGVQGLDSLQRLLSNL